VVLGAGLLAALLLVLRQVGVDVREEFDSASAVAVVTEQLSLAQGTSDAHLLASLRGCSSARTCATCACSCSTSEALRCCQRSMSGPRQLC
jgi:hypothetical protein